MNVWSRIHTSVPQDACITRKAPGWSQQDWVLCLVDVRQDICLRQGERCQKTLIYEERAHAGSHPTHSGCSFWTHQKSDPAGIHLEGSSHSAARVSRSRKLGLGTSLWNVLPVWTSLPDASKICSEPVKYSCKKGCRGQCSCAMADVPCAALCVCDGKCQRDWTTSFINWFCEYIAMDIKESVFTRIPPLPQSMIHLKHNAYNAFRPIREGSHHGRMDTASDSWVRVCGFDARGRWCVLGKGTLLPFPTLSDESINRGLVCVARIPSSTDFKDPDAHVLDGWVPATATRVPSMHLTPEVGMRLPKWWRN